MRHQKKTLDVDRRQRVGVLADALEETLDEEERRAPAHALDLGERISGTVRGRPFLRRRARVQHRITVTGPKRPAPSGRAWEPSGSGSPSARALALPGSLHADDRRAPSRPAGQRVPWYAPERGRCPVLVGVLGPDHPLGGPAARADAKPVVGQADSRPGASSCGRVFKPSGPSRPRRG
ncbi:hypothetical protein GCM10010415_75430 [Streptomyces atrovirens]